MNIPNRYEPAQCEPKWREFWEKENIYKFDKESNKPIFSVDTPPPYVSAAHLHVGHAMSYSQAEFIIRYKRMQGFNIFYPMGFDDNGLPTERFVETTYKIDKSKIKRPDFIKLCLEETKKGGETYMKLWKELGLSIDWDLLYSTINPQCRKIAQRSFIDLLKKERIARRNDPINWCPTCETALAQADIELEEKETLLNYINFSSEDGKSKLMIATTRPELIPACVALFVNPNDGRYKHLVGKNAIVPVFNYSVPVKTDEAVDIQYGTGLMMVCTWGDSEDIKKWKEHKLDTRVVVEKNGRLSEKAGFLSGLPIPVARVRILESLKEQGFLVKQEKIVHQLGVHERCHTTVEFNHAPQWFIKILDLKDEVIKRGTELKWYPDYMRIQFEHWVEGLKWDWCISRQRYYGVPFPVWYCSSCNQIILPEDKDLPVDPTVETPKTDMCPACGGKEFLPENDVMDTWMTSSLTPLINAKWGDSENLMNKIYPMGVRVQAFEIIRTWLYYTVVKSHLHTDSLPWKDAMISGWGLDSKGKKMSKRSGNFVTPEDMIQKYGADSLRYWAAEANLGCNLNFNESEIANGKKLLTKLWNAAKFIDMHMKDFAKFDRVPDKMVENLGIIDKALLSRLNTVVRHSTENFDRYEFSRVKNEVEKFFWVDFCDNYLEIVKDKLYKPEVYGDVDRKNAQWVLYYSFFTLTKLFAPFIPYIAEELYHTFFKTEGLEKSVHLSTWPHVLENFNDEGCEQSFEKCLEIISVVRKFKTENNVSLNTPVELVITSDKPENLVIIKEFEKDLKSATRYSSLKYEGPTEYQIEKHSFNVGVKVSPQPSNS